MEMQVSVPETSINALNIGLPAEIRLSSGEDGVLRAAVSEIGTSSFLVHGCTYAAPNTRKGGGRCASRAHQFRVPSPCLQLDQTYMSLETLARVTDNPTVRLPAVAT